MIRSTVAMGAALAFAACGGGDPEPGADEAGAATETAETTPTAGVVISEPADGATFDAGPVRVVMEVMGLVVAPAGTMDPGTGHHHLVVNADVDWSLPIPNDPGVHYHMGLGQPEFTLEELPPGEHRIIAVVADGVHVPLDPPVSDTITVVIR